MDKNSKFDYQALLQKAADSGSLPSRTAAILESFFDSYSDALAESGQKLSDHKERMETYIQEVIHQCKQPFQFEPYHERVRTPFDYYSFGVEFLRPLVDLPHSVVKGVEHLKTIQKRLAQKENVIFLANHQTEADPQAISLLMEKQFPQVAEEMIFVAGERVITDPLAIPFSWGRNLLCIYSKRYIDHPPELKRSKQLHNQKTMQLLSALLSEGGRSIYIAPSGGRDRANAQGIVEIAAFDPQSIEMLYLMAQKAERPTHFHPMALATYDLLPPPETVQLELGEKRRTKRIAIHMAIGSAIDMQHYPGSENPDKHVRRKCRADYIWGLVRKDYLSLPGAPNEPSPP